VPIVVDHAGLRPVKVGTLPPELAAHCAPHVFVQHLTVRAALEGDRDAVYRAAVLDRHAASVLTLGQIRAMTDELIAAHGDAMPTGVRMPPVQQAAE
jgi:alpha-galactosidase